MLEKFRYLSMCYKKTKGNKFKMPPILTSWMFKITQYYIDPELYYWVREKSGSESEIDYLIQLNARIIPIEVKSGTTGTLRSLHTFMKTKRLKKALRLNADCPSATNVKVKDHTGELIEYELISLPLYLAEQIYRFIS